MLPILLMMLAILLLAGVVVLYVAFPHREKDLPKAPWVGTVLRKGAQSLPKLEEPADTRRH